jgi:hypothetical protein
VTTARSHSRGQLIADSFKARGKNPQAQDALERSKALAQR